MTKDMGAYQPWDCNERLVPSSPCNLANSCSLPFKTQNVTDTRYVQSHNMLRFKINGLILFKRYLATCFQCPKVYPWYASRFFFVLKIINCFVNTYLQFLHYRLGDAKGKGLPEKDVYKSDNPSL